MFLPSFLGRCILCFLALGSIPVGFINRKNKFKKIENYKYIIISSVVVNSFLIYLNKYFGLFAIFNFFLGNYLCLIGITGGIAVGKSTFCNFLKKKNVVIINADDITSQIYKRGSPCYKKIVKHFGEEILNNDKSINRILLRKIVFNNEENVKYINKITHTYIIIQIIKECLKYKFLYLKHNVAIEAPLLIETKLYLLTSPIILIKSSVKNQIKRILSRDKNCTYDTAMGIIKNQLPTDEKIKFSDIIINNDDGLIDLEMKCDVVYNKYLKNFFF
ncbi:dephospho-CoA kinase, putative [Plasmodium vinckei brucechwatti]|uniref:Dephospho-CoA kinase, putative n=1 Tax=Plasmodium vinckei brucechwatti TaxID=119398 RepID=A0A6V7SPB1_PLAVN|nr:dephospho-CoA kinase, putative [Plasmodium vinckei brucechwatti]